MFCRQSMRTTGYKFQIERKSKVIMKRLLILVCLFLVGCASTIQPTEVKSQQNETSSPSPTILPSLVPSETATSTKAITQTPTPIPTITPDPRLSRGVEYLVENPIYCAKPCLWGVIPGLTKIDDATTVFRRLGMDFSSGTPEYFSTSYQMKDGLQGSILFTTSKEIVSSIRYTLSGFYEIRDRSKWSVYFPSSIIKEFGRPTRINYFMDQPHDPPFWVDKYTFDLIFFYEDKGFIAAYEMGMVYSKDGFIFICPDDIDFKFIDMWYGDYPEHAPFPDPSASIEKVLGIKLDEFVNSLTSNSKSCFKIRQN
jgi:hypothetical protein